MIQLLSHRYKRLTAWSMFFTFYGNLFSPGYAYARINILPESAWFSEPHIPNRHKMLSGGSSIDNNHALHEAKGGGDVKSLHKEKIPQSQKRSSIGGPSSPEATSFKAAGSDNLVNLFTGDFSYSIPLLDVGGYPINLFYNAGIGMEQEASWVGLGWNINPGTVSRNMRGVPDDFDGTDSLIQEQNAKPNRTWGGEIGVDGEVIGIKEPKVSLSLGFSYNNYLGPALDLGTNISLSLASLNAFGAEKMAPSTVKNDSSKSPGNLGLALNAGVKLSSRSGLTFSPSLNANLTLTNNHLSTGVGLNTSYNSRTGIKDITLHSEMSFYNAADKSQEKYKDATHIGTSIGSSTFSFAKPSYMPALRMPMENANYSGQLELGAGLFGLRGSLSGSGYYIESDVPVESRVVKKPLVGFLYSENAVNNPNAVMDFNRVNDAEVTPNTPVISAPEYTYDIFSIQGEGTGGSIRAYRGDMGFMRDNVTVSKDKNISIGFDAAPPGHYGGNWNSISTPTKVGGWEDVDNTLQQSLNFTGSHSGSAFENVYFKNPGEASVTNPEVLQRIGMDNLVRFQLGGSNVNPRLESSLEQFNKHTGSNLPVLNISNDLKSREKRTQVTTMLTADEASKIGLEKQLRNYNGNFDSENDLEFETINRVGGYRKAHHISEIDVLEQNGMRYVYGIPVYNVTQKDFTFSVDELPNTTTNLINAASDEPYITSHSVATNSSIDGYVQSQETPAFASSFLITGLLSADYVDVTGNGISEDDLGNAVKFNYTKSTGLHKWRTPRINNDSFPSSAHFNDGVRTEKKDNKATISYGEREAWYLNSIESKSMIAIFKTEARSDAKGVVGEMDGRANVSEDVNKKLSRIDLYTKAEIKANGIANARPLKTVLFYYASSDNSLCKGTPDNPNGGKLTLDSILFSYNGQAKLKKEKYVFNYGNKNSSTDNPDYAYNASDRWGTYKNPSDSSNHGLTNIDFPYTPDSKQRCDQYAAAWSLKKILLPSGGQMEVQYEADDYAYTQNRRSCSMFNIYGLGKTMNYSSGNAMYNLGLPSEDNNYVYIKLPTPLTSSINTKAEIKSKYLDDTTSQLAFKLMVNMPKGPEPLTVYPDYDDYGVCPNSPNKDYIYIHLKAVDGKSPLANSAIGFLTENIPDQAFPGYEAHVDNLSDFIHLATDMLGAVLTAFKNVDQQMRSAPYAQTIELQKSFIRLNNPWKTRYGGGVRVKRVTMQDNWSAMTGQYNSTYGQDYDYTTTEKINGKDTTISSGVASYEPGIGSEENPFRSILAFSNKLPLASAQYGAIEQPILEGLYPAPCVGYSKVTVRSIHRNGTHGDSTLRSAIGKQVTEFYTAKDYPTFSINTGMSVMDYNKAPWFSLLYKEIVNRRTISQGFLVETNDMHGKMKSQAAYSESDENTPLSYSLHKYKNTGKNGVNDQVDFVYNNEEGIVHSGNMGIDAELMTDVREFSVQSDGFNGQPQLDIFPFAFIIVTIFTLWPLKTYIENRYRAVTCTKLINYHAIEDSLVVMDKGSIITTKTIAYDAETGSPVVTQTSNEFNDSVYNVNYPAYWAYSSVGPAYKNIGRQFNNVTFYDGKITSTIDTTAFESGDELYINQSASGDTACIPHIFGISRLWAFDKNKDSTALTIPHSDLVFIDSIGKIYTGRGTDFKIIRSGKRNNLGLMVSTATAMKNPIQLISGTKTLILNNSNNIVSASATEYKEKWQTDNDVMLKKVYYTPACSSVESDSSSCSGILEKNINPYVKGLIGNLMQYRSYVYYGSRNETDPNTHTNIRKNGYITGFSNFWSFNSNSNLIPDTANHTWVWNSQITRINSRSQELETQNPLNVYTSSQYGYNKNLPEAIANNARYEEMGYDGFEDYYYDEQLNKAALNTCGRKHFDLSDYKTSIVETDTTTFHAHSGKYVLKVNPNQNLTVGLKIASDVNAFSLINQLQQAELVGNLGVHIDSSSLYPQYASVSANESNPSTGLHITTFQNGSEKICHSDGGYDISNSFILYSTHYIQVPACDTYHITTLTSNSYQQVWGTIVFKIYNEQGMLIPITYTGYDASHQYSKCFLSAGIYKVVTNLYGGGSKWCDGPQYPPCNEAFAGNKTNAAQNKISPVPNYPVQGACTQDPGYMSSNYYSFEIGSPQLPVYANVTEGCTATKPIAASDSMLNPLFSLTPGKRMLFSAWVKATCDTPCYRTSYDKSHVELKFSGGSNVIDTFLTSGPIIEGWQKIEGEFTVPENAGFASLVLINDTSKNIYFDDIRIHPFNGNMKSYVYDPHTLKLSAELDENNYATFYEYDEEGQLVRVKKETIQGIKTISETRNAKQKNITDIQ